MSDASARDDNDGSDRQSEADEPASGANRPYRSPRRAEQAAATRAAVLASARELFVTKGYAATTIADIARHARVAVDTVYASVGRKPALLREVLETALSGTDVAVPAAQRDYVQRVREAPTAPGRSPPTSTA